MKNVRVGDKLVLRKDLEVGKDYGGVISDLTLEFFEKMKILEGNKIEEVDYNSVFVDGVGDYIGYYYTFEMLDLDYYKELRKREELANKIKEGNITHTYDTYDNDTLDGSMTILELGSIHTLVAVKFERGTYVSATYHHSNYDEVYKRFKVIKWLVDENIDFDLEKVLGALK